MTGAGMAAGVGFVAYSYAGYPALAWAASRTRRPRVRPAGRLPGCVTVVVAAHEEADVIGTKVRETLALADELDGRCECEVIVAVDGPDPTAAEARRVRDARVRVLHHEHRRGKAAAMVDATRRARGDVIVFTDANAHVEPGSLAVLLAWFGDPSVAVVSGAKRTVGAGSARGDGGDGAYWSYESKLKEWETRAGTTVAVVGELLAVRRELVDTLPADVVNDDFFLAMQALRAGSSVVYEPGARTWEPAPATAHAERTRRRRIVAGRAQAATRWREVLPLRRPVVLVAVVSHKYSRPLVPVAALVASAGAVRALLRPRSPLHRVAGAALLAAELAMLLAGAMADAVPHRARWTRRGAVICRMLVEANASSALGLVDHARRRTTTLWPRISRSSA